MFPICYKVGVKLSPVCNIFGVGMVIEIYKALLT